MQLYVERGYEQTTVADIAERAGLTERTFFRHFADKREVLFRGAGDLQALIVAAVLGASLAATPIEAVTTGLQAAGTVFGAHRERSRWRQTIIDANAELQARELSKMAALAAAITAALHQRGMTGPSAALTANVGIVVFRTAFAHWVGEDSDHDWPQLIRESLEELKMAVAGE